MLPLLLAIAIFLQTPATSSSQVTFNAGVDVVTFRLSIINEKTREPIADLTAKDFAVKVDKKAREITVDAIAADETSRPYYIIAFKPAEADRGTRKHVAELFVTIKGKTFSVVKRPFVVPRR